ncbi:MAG: hypothetical protein JW737_08725 [Acidobacteria bacterium]|nr:hypothetical protein [Acidobacteriota bacterium]
MKRVSIPKPKYIFNLSLFVLIFCVFTISNLNAQAQATATTKKEIKQIDYYIDSITAEDNSGNSLQAGESGKVVIKWKRTGPDPSSGNQLKVWMDGADFAFSENEPELKDITMRIPWTATAGTHTIKAVIDYGNRVRESNEFNNVKSVKIFIMTRPTLTVIKPDLFIRNVAVIQDGSRYPYYNAAEPVTLRCIWSRSGPVISTDWRIQFFINDRPIDTPSTAAPSPSDTSGTFSKTYTFPKLGRWDISCKVDVNEEVYEDKEDNNERKISVLAQ